MRILPLLLGTLTLFATHSPAEERVENVGYFLHWTERLTGLKNVGVTPEIILLSTEELSKVYCAYKPVTDDCEVNGLTRWPFIYVNKDLPQRDMELTIIHELTHYLHFSTNTFKSRCWSEFQAARVEWTYEAVVYGAWQPFQFDKAWYNCP